METKEVPRVVRVSLDEFELEGGRVYPLPFELDEEMSPEKFQMHYSKWWYLIIGMDKKDV